MRAATRLPPRRALGPQIHRIHLFAVTSQSDKIAERDGIRTARGVASLNNSPLPDIYEAPTSSFDATFATSPWARWRLKFTARNLLDPRVRRMFGDHEESGYYNGRSFSAAVSFGS